MLERLPIWNIYVKSEKSMRSWGPFIWLWMKYVDFLVLMAFIYKFFMQTILENIRCDGAATAHINFFIFSVLRKPNHRIFLYLRISRYSILCNEPLSFPQASQHHFRIGDSLVLQIRKLEAGDMRNGLPKITQLGIDKNPGLEATEDFLFLIHHTIPGSKGILMVNGEMRLM